MDGLLSEKFQEFRRLLLEAFKVLRKSSDEIVCLCEIMERSSVLPCFTGANAKPVQSTSIEPFRSSIGSESDVNASDDPKAAGLSGLPVSALLRSRFLPNLSESQLDEAVHGLIDSSCNNVFTKLYDTFQYYSQSVF